jgi:hypothetical protein
MCECCARSGEDRELARRTVEMKKGCLIRLLGEDRAAGF